MAVVICVGLLLGGGVVSWLTIRPEVLREDRARGGVPLDGGAGSG
jgi:hypothetical protein